MSINNNNNQANTALEFMAQLQRLVPPFVQDVETTLASSCQLDASSYLADHVCWRTETMAEYTHLVQELKQANQLCQLLVESEIGGRPISTFQLTQGIPVTRPVTTLSNHHCQSPPRLIDIVEIPAPKPGRFYPRGLEHVEFVIPSDEKQNTTTTTALDLSGDADPAYPTPVNNEHHQAAFAALQKRHGTLDWNTRAASKDLNPDISLSLTLPGDATGRPCSVKFHLVPLANVIQYEKSLPQSLSNKASQPKE